MPNYEITMDVEDSGSGTIVDPTQLNDAGNAKRAEAWAVGQRNGVDVPSTDPTYHNNSKYYAQQAGSSAGSASSSADAAAAAAQHYPYVDSTSGNWMVWDTSTSAFVDTGVHAQGPTGPTGHGVPSGGAAGQVLKKVNGTDYNAEWANNDGTTIPMSSSDSTSINQAISRNATVSTDFNDYTVATGKPDGHYYGANISTFTNKPSNEVAASPFSLDVRNNGGYIQQILYVYQSAGIPRIYVRQQKWESGGARPFGNWDKLVLKSEVDVIGITTTGTKVSPAPEVSNGSTATLATISLTKGAWLLRAGGYSPIQKNNAVSGQSTTCHFATESGTINGLNQNGTTLTYMFNLIVPVVVTSDTAVASFRVINWMGETLTAGTSYTITAIRLI